MSDWLAAIILGLVEGLTEFIPVSSTGHLLLLGHFMGFESKGKTFEVVIQLGAILAIVSVYFRRLWTLAIRWPTDPGARHFILGVLIAFLPAAAAGVLLYPIIKGFLFETPLIICIALIVGGVLLLMLDRMKRAPRYLDVNTYPMRVYALIGIFQCLALVPGVSRSGATIAGGLLLGTDKRSAAEFTFFLAMPTMTGAFAYDLYANRDVVTADGLMVVAVGFVAAFAMAVVVVRWLLDYVSRHGFALFAWWRILVGAAGFAGLALLG